MDDRGEKAPGARPTTSGGGAMIYAMVMRA